MATGGGGIGARGSHQIFEAYGTLVWKDKAYYDGLLRAEKAINKFVAHVNTVSKTIGFHGAAPGIARLAGAFNTLNAALEISVRRSALLLRQLRALGGTGTLPGLSRVIGAHGTAISRVVAGIGRGIGNAIGGSLRGLFNAGSGSFMRQSLTGFGNAFNSIARGFGSVLNSTLRGSATMLRAVVSSLMQPLRMMRGMMRVGALGAGIGGALTLAGASRVAIDQERTLATLRRITGASQAEMAQLSSGINQTASRTPGVSLGRFYEVAETGARMDVPLKDLQSFSEGMARLGIVLDETELPLKEAANRIGSLISVFGDSYDSAIRYGSALVKLDQMSTASARDIIDIANRFSGPAATFGMKPQESLALATALRQARVPVETAGTSVGQILMRMSSRRDLPAFARMAGMKSGQFAGMIERDPMAALKAVTVGLAEIDRKFGAVASSRALDKLHLDGQRVRGTLLQLSRTIPLLDTYLATANQEWESLTAIMEGQAIAGNTLTAQWEATKTAFKLVSIELGRGLIPFLKGASTGLRNFASDAAKFISANGPALEQFGAKARTTMETIGVLWKQWPEVLAYAQVTVEDKLAKIAASFQEFGSQVLENMKWLASSIPSMIGNIVSSSLRAISTSISSWFSGISGRLAALPGNLMSVIPGGGGGFGKPGSTVTRTPFQVLKDMIFGRKPSAAPAARAAEGFHPVQAAIAGGWAGEAAKGIPGMAVASTPAAPAAVGGAGGVGGIGAGIPAAPGFDFARIRAAGAAVAPSDEAARLRGSIRQGIENKRSQDWAAGLGAPWANPLAGITALAAGPLMAGAMAPGGMMNMAGMLAMKTWANMAGPRVPSVAGLTPGTRAYRAAMRAKQATYGPSRRPAMPYRAPWTGGIKIGAPKGMMGISPNLDALGTSMAMTVRPSEGDRTPDRRPASRRAGVGRGANTYAGRVWEANRARRVATNNAFRARRVATNNAFRSWRNNVDAMMRGERPMMGDGRRVVSATDSNDPAKKIDKTNDLLTKIKEALERGATGPAKGKPPVAVLG